MYQIEGYDMPQIDDILVKWTGPSDFKTNVSDRVPGVPYTYIDRATAYSQFTKIISQFFRIKREYERKYKNGISSFNIEQIKYESKRVRECFFTSEILKMTGLYNNSGADYICKISHDVLELDSAIQMEIKKIGKMYLSNPSSFRANIRFDKGASSNSDNRPLLTQASREEIRKIVLNGRKKKNAYIPEAASEE